MELKRPMSDWVLSGDRSSAIHTSQHHFTQFTPIHTSPSELLQPAVNYNTFIDQLQCIVFVRYWCFVQEFLLKYYLRGRYPDLLIIFPPFNHDKKSQTSSSLAIRLKYFIDLLDLYLPASTRVSKHGRTAAVAAAAATGTDLLVAYKGLSALY